MKAKLLVTKATINGKKAYQFIAYYAQNVSEQLKAVGFESDDGITYKAIGYSQEECVNFQAAYKPLFSANLMETYK